VVSSDRRAARVAIAAMLLVACAGVGRCGGSRGSPGSPSPVILTGHIDDAAGDAAASGDVSISPDLTGATLQASGGTLAARVTFAPGTLDQGSVFCRILLDTDEDPQTGTPDPGGTAFGADYEIDAVYPPFSATAILVHITRPGFGQLVGRADVRYPAPDVMSLEIELRLLDSDDGRMAFRLEVSQWLEDRSGGNSIGGVTTAVLDSAPDAGGAAGKVG
jgi:hypothetical protein